MFYLNKINAILMQSEIVMLTHMSDFIVRTSLIYRSTNSGDRYICVVSFEIISSAAAFSSTFLKGTSPMTQEPKSHKRRFPS